VKSDKSRVFGLDVLRAVAILAVMQAHGYYLVSRHVNAHHYNPLWLDGVSIFFVLSGFLIGRILIDMFDDGNFSPLDVIQFWIRRWFRTLPSFYLVLGTLIAVYYYRNEMLSPTFLDIATFTQNITHGPPQWFEEAWSLAVEEWFYFSVPILMFLAFHTTPAAYRRHALLFVIFGAIFGSMAYRVWCAVDLGYAFTFSGVEWTEQITMPVLCRLESIMLGVLGAYLMKHHGDRLRAAGWLLLALGALMIVATSNGHFMTDHAAVALFMNYGYVTTLGLGALLMLPKLSSIKTGNGPIAAAITFISKISYPMYLTNLVLAQLTILPWIRGALGWPKQGDLLQCFSELVIWWTLTIGLSFAIHRLFELPIMNLRDKLRFRSKRPATIQLRDLYAAPDNELHAAGDDGRVVVLRDIS